MNISIIIPCRNEAPGLAVILPELRRLYPEAEIVISDDASTDETKEVIAPFQVKHLKRPYALGNGGAVKAGARAAGGDILVFMDGDSQHNPVDIPGLLAKLEDGYDMVVGARQSGSQASLGRGIANRFYNWLATYMTGHRVDDLTSGYRAVRANKFREFLYLLPNGFSYPTTCTMAFFRAGYSVAYVPIRASPRIGKSHIRLLRDGARFFIIIFKVGTMFSPLKIFIPAALAMLMLATGWYGWTFLSQGRFTNMSALLYTGSVMVFLMGLISEQITALMYKKID